MRVAPAGEVIKHVKSTFLGLPVNRHVCEHSRLPRLSVRVDRREGLDAMFRHEHRTVVTSTSYGGTKHESRREKARIIAEQSGAYWGDKARHVAGQNTRYCEIKR